MSTNDTSRNGQSPLQRELGERRFWVWESALRGQNLGSVFRDAERTKAAGLKPWTKKEEEQRGTFAYAHSGERLQYQHPKELLESLKSVRLALEQVRASQQPAAAALPAVLPKEWDNGVMRAMCRLELATRFPWRTRELFGWTDDVLLSDEVESQSNWSTIDFSTGASIDRTIVQPIMRLRPSASGEVPQPASPKSAYWLKMTRDLASDDNPPLEHLTLLKDTADFGANYLLRLLYLFGPLPPQFWSPSNPCFAARQVRKSFDEVKFSLEMLKEWTSGKPVNSPAERAALQQRLAKILAPFRDPIATDARFSKAVAEIIKQALLRFKYWLDEPFLCKDNDKLHKARAARKIAEQEEMTFWSENHYILFATAEYLAGQLWPEELFLPGKDFRDPADVTGALTGKVRMSRAKPRLLKWLNHRIMLGWSEWNAPGYYREHAEALYNLVDFCLDDEVRTKANIALDLLMFDVARLNHRGSFGVTGARAQSKFKVSGWDQAAGDWIEFLFGTRGAFGEEPSNLAVIAAGSGYQVPDVLLEIGTHLPDRPIIDMSRVSVHFNEASRYGIGVTGGAGWVSEMENINQQIATTHQSGYNQADDDTVFWWGRGAYFNKQVVDSSVRLLEKYGLEHTSPFTAYGELFGGGMNTGEDFAAIGGAVAGVGLLGGAGPIGVIVGAGAGAFGMSALLGKGAMRPAILGGRIAASTAALMAFGAPGLILSIPLAGWPFGDDEDFADDLSIFLEGSSLTRANLYTWRDRGAMLSTTQDFRSGQLNFQSSFSQATLSMEASAWTTAPFSGATGFDAEHVDGPGWWTGYWSSPRIVQFENAAIAAYRPHAAQNTLHTNASHCWLPKEALTEFVEGIRPSNVEGDDDGSWAFGKIVHPDGVEGYIGVYSARDADYQNKDSDFYKDWWESEVKDKMDELGTKEGDPKEVAAAVAEWLTLARRWSGGMVVDFFAGKDLYAEDDNIWIIQVGSSTEFGSFQKFREEVTGARIHIDFGDMQCSYDIPRRGRLELHTDIDDDEAREEGRFRFLGERLATDYYPRYSSPFVRAGRVEWGQPEWAIQWKAFSIFYSLVDPSSPSRILNRAPPGTESRQLRALALRIRTEHEEMEEDTVARATVRSAGRVIVSRQIVARGEVSEHTDHDVEWLFFDPVDGGQLLTVEIEHGPSDASGDDEPDWRMRFDLWALTADSRLLPCKVDFGMAANFNSEKVVHLNFEDEHRSSGELPATIVDL